MQDAGEARCSKAITELHMYNDLTFPQETKMQNYVWYSNETYFATVPRAVVTTKLKKFWTKSE
jgi:hypothetical protein